MGRSKQHDGEARWGRSSNADKRSKEGEASRATKTVQQQDGEKQVGQDGGGGAISNADRRNKQQDGEAWQARRNKEQVASKMGET